MIIKLTLNEILDADIIALITPKIDAGLPASVAIKRLIRELVTIQTFAASTFASTPQITPLAETDWQSTSQVTQLDDDDDFDIDFDAMAEEMGGAV